MDGEKSYLPDVNYSSKTYREAQNAWTLGNFSPMWDAVRLRCAYRGFIYPPSGTPSDSRRDPNPSRRAIIAAALEDHPVQTLQIVSRSRSWSEVVSGIFEMELELALWANERELEDAEAKRSRDGGDAERRVETRRGMHGAEARPVSVGSLLGTLDLGTRKGTWPDE